MSCLWEGTYLVCRRVHVMFLTCTLLQTQHVPSYKQDMYTPTNKTGTLLQTRHVPSYKHDMYPPTNNTCTLLQTLYVPSGQIRTEHRLYAYIVTDIPVRYCFFKHCILLTRPECRQILIHRI
jgi:hypothetical protein